MARKWVVNASPLIVLGRLSQLPLLTELAQTLVVPAAVAHEIVQGPEEDAARIWLSTAGRAFVEESRPLEPVVAAWDLGAGESAVISRTLKSPDFEAILDDLAARKCAAALSVPIRGTLGVLLLAKKEGLVTELAPLLNDVQRAGFRIRPDVLDTIRRLEETLG